MAKKRGAVTELHSKPRKMNQDAKKRITVVLPAALILKLKIASAKSGETLQKFVAQILTKHIGD